MQILQRAKLYFVIFQFILLLGEATAQKSIAQSPQNPSPMVEHLRPHPRLTKTNPPGRREKLTLGRLFVPEKLDREPTKSPVPLIIAFHCGDWIPEVAAAGLSRPLPCVTMQLGSGSSRYAKPFTDDPKLLATIVAESEKALNRPVSALVLVGWSAGYGAIRELIKNPECESKIASVLLLDGLHTGYLGGKPGPMESKLEEPPLEPFLAYARKAVKGEKWLYFLHTEIFPGTFASTTETADWLIGQLHLKRMPVLKWGPMKTQQLAETLAGNLRIDAFAGNSAPDHVDLLHALPSLLPGMVP